MLNPRLFGYLFDVRLVLVLALSVTVIACSSTGSTAEPETSTSTDAAGPRIFQPGAPGAPSKEVDQSILDADPRPPYTEADVAFMQGMIHHHAQALEMTALVDERSDDRGLALLAKRIEITQRDEIILMQDWLKDRGEEAPMPHAPGMQMDHGAMGHDVHMPGMLTPDQMAELEASTGDTFYRLFLEYMIDHHAGAIVMVEELFSHDGAAQDTEVFRFATDVDVDQRMEIGRMQGMLNANE